MKIFKVNNRGKLFTSFDFMQEIRTRSRLFLENEEELNRLLIIKQIRLDII